MDANLKQRIITAAILLPVVIIATIYAPIIITVAVVTVAGYFGAEEINRMLKLKRLHTVPSILVAVTLPSLFALHKYELALVVVAAGFLHSAFYKLFEADPTHKYIDTLAKCGMSMIYPGLLMATFIPLREINSNIIWLLFATVMMTDTFAYLGGRKLGKTPLAPAISPKKTREGLIIGMATSFIFALVLNSMFLHFNWFFVIVASALVIPASVIGDLIESAIKRDAGVKDSGTIIPGHGGILDRLDSLIICTPVMLLVAIGLF